MDESHAEQIIRELLANAAGGGEPVRPVLPADEPGDHVMTFPDGSRLIVDDDGNPRLELDYSTACAECAAVYIGPAALVMEAAKWCENDHRRQDHERRAWPYGTYNAMRVDCRRCGQTIRGRVATVVAHTHSCQGHRHRITVQRDTAAQTMWAAPTGETITWADLVQATAAGWTLLERPDDQ